MSKAPDWFISEIEKYRENGFFGPEAVNEIADEIISESENSYFGSILKLQEDPLFVPVLLSYDKEKVWFVEDWMVLGWDEEFKADFNGKVFEGLRSISGGRFEAKNIVIEECGYCSGRDKRLNIAFDLEGKRSDVNFCIDGSVLVLSFLEELNELLAPTGHSFQVIRDNYGPCFIFFLSQEQKAFLSAESKQPFLVHPTYWLDRAQYARDAGDTSQAEEYFNKAILHKGESFAIAEYGALLVDLEKKNEAIEVYRLGIENLGEPKEDDEKKKWWRDLFQRELAKLSGDEES